MMNIPLQKDEIQRDVSKLFQIAKFKLNNDISLTDILLVYAEDTYLPELLMQHEIDKVSRRRSDEKETDNDYYNTLCNAQDALWTYLEDTLEDTITKYLTKRKEYILPFISIVANGIRSPKRARVIQEQLWFSILELDKIYTDILPKNLPIPSIEEDMFIDKEIGLIAKVISEVVLQKFKPLQDIKREVKKDLKKFVAVDGKKGSSYGPELRLVFSKNISSFFAKSSAGICTAADTDLFHRKDHFHINIIDDKKNICVGNVQAYIYKHQWEDYLFLRWFNPSVNVLKNVSPDAFCESVLEIAKWFCKDNNLQWIILSDPGTFVALSNRSGVAKYLKNRYSYNTISIEDFRIATHDTAVINSWYMINI